MAKLSHVDTRGRASMVNVGGKSITARRAVAEGRVRLGRAYGAVKGDRLEKGSVEACARVAAIQAAKATSSLIPLCHPLALDHVSVDFRYTRDSLVVRVEVATSSRTGVEMEALTGAAVACLTIYDMAKGIDKGMQISAVRLLRKEGGKSGLWKARRQHP